MTMLPPQRSRNPTNGSSFPPPPRYFSRPRFPRSSRLPSPLPVSLILLLLLSASTLDSLPPPRVAVCFVGGIRTFPVPEVHGLLKTRLIDALSPRTDSFFQVKLRDNKGFSGSVQDVERAIASFKPVYTDLDKKYGTTSYVRRKARPVCTSPLTQNLRVGVFIEQFTALEKCWGAIQAYEAEKKFTYDYVVRVRPDLLFLDPLLPARQYNLSAIYSVGYSTRVRANCSIVHPRDPSVNLTITSMQDHFFLAPRKLAPVAFTPNSYLNSACAGRPNYNVAKAIATSSCFHRFYPESTLAMHFETKHVPITTLNGTWYIMVEMRDVSMNGHLDLDAIDWTKAKQKRYVREALKNARKPFVRRKMPPGSPAVLQRKRRNMTTDEVKAAMDRKRRNVVPTPPPTPA